MKVESTKQEEIQNDTALLSPQMAQRSHQMPLREMPCCNQPVSCSEIQIFFFLINLLVARLASTPLLRFLSCQTNGTCRLLT